MDLPFLPTDSAPTISNPSSDMNSNDENPAEESDFSDAILKFINQILMEEDIDGETCAFKDSALQAAEKPFYDILGEQYPLSNLTSPCQCVKRPSKHYTSHNCDSCMTTNHVDESCLTYNLLENESSCMIAMPFDYSLQSYTQSSSQLVCPPRSTTKEAQKSLPHGNHIPLELDYSEKCKGDHLLHKPRKGKNHHQVESVLETRSEKLSAVYIEESELPQMYDKLLLSIGGDDETSGLTVDESLQNGPGKMLHQDGQSKGSTGGTTHRGRRVQKRDLVDLRTLLIHCAEATAGNDYRSAYELLKQIRRHSSPFGDGSQRLAHYFCNSLESRLAGTGSEEYAALVANRILASSMLKACRLFISVCPFKKMSNFFATQTILQLAEKATRLHIIHFGVLYGYQWPCLIQHLSTRPGGPPVLCITGIDHPQPGFRPAARSEETGRRLAYYCERFNVPFEYNAIAQKWETIQFEDLKIARNEVIVVNCLYQFRYLLDETEVLNSPRDAVLNLIKRINPDVFIHGVVNGAYNAPFFISRFREALYYFSAVFDMFEANALREDQERMVYEKDVYGRQIFNVIACEGSKRVERPETYKQWQVRNMRAGFRQLPLNQEIIKKVRAQVKLCYHKDFLMDVESQWMLQGWKGRVLLAVSTWKVA